MASRTFSEIMKERVTVLAQDDPDNWVRLSDIAFQVGKAMGRAYHSYKAQRLLDGSRVSPDRREVQAWITATGLQGDAAAEAWHAAGLWPPGLTSEAYRKALTDARAEHGGSGSVRPSTAHWTRHLRVLAPAA